MTEAAERRVHRVVVDSFVGSAIQVVTALLPFGNP